MPYFNTNDESLAQRLCEKLNKRLGYNGIKYLTSKNETYIKKHGKYQVKINQGQAMNLNIDPEIGCQFSSEEVSDLLK